MNRILIADDHSVVRKGIRQIITEEFPYSEIDEAGDAKELLELARQKTYDVIVSDLIMPGKNSIEVIKDLQSQGIKTPVIILSMHPEEQYALRVLKAGGSGYITKESAPDELVKAIHTVMNGKKYINENVSQILLSKMDSGNDIPLHEKLSDREFSVLKHIAEGKSVGEIAQLLNLSIPTISTYRARILDKTKMKSNSELIRYAISQNLIQ